MVEKDGFKFMADINEKPIELIFDSLEKFDSAKDYIRKHKFTGAAFSWGYPYKNIDFLSEYPWLTDISIFIPDIINIDVINYLPSLMDITWEDPIPVKIENPSLKNIYFVWHKDTYISEKCKNLSSVVVTSCKDIVEFFNQLIKLPNLTSLAIIKIIQ